MVAADRILRFLVRDRPEVGERLVRRIAPHSMPQDAKVTSSSVDDSELHLPPPLDADFVARAGDNDVLHVEFQGYRDTGFVDRLFRYHLALAVRYPGRHVTTVAVWLMRPPAPQIPDVIQRGSITVRVISVILSEVPAALLLEDPETACFAAGADAGDWTDTELCTLVARALAEMSAPYSVRQAAVVLAACRGRYDAMIRALSEADLETPIIIDLVKLGEDMGFEKGREAGFEKGREAGFEKGREAGAREELRQAVVGLLAARGIAPTTDQRALIESEQDLERLRAWLIRGATAQSVAQVFDQ